MDPHPSTSVFSRKKYDVFISFRGVDTRYNFTSHIHKALLKQNIETYMDDRLEKGDEIEHTLLNAIGESKLSVIIFSENYASSLWCLNELMHILRCKEKNNQIVIPVFYHVSPSDVRKQEGSYGVAFAKLEERFKDGIGKIEQWREALTTAANLSGWDAPIDRYESELVESIVKDVMEKLNYTLPSTNDFDGLIGIDKRIEHIESLLLSDYIRVLGIWGMAGIGKTALAHIIFSRLYHRFEGHCFLGNVREEWKKHGQIHFRNRLFAQLLEEENLGVIDMQFVKNRLYRKNVLIVLDDVDDLEKFENLVGACYWFAPESKIIITTRNKQVLKRVEVDHIYKVQQLDENDAFRLFCLNAFNSNSPPRSFSELSKQVVRYAAGMPLALKVLGSHLYSKSKDEWESALNKLKLVPNQTIQNILRISFDDGLDYQEQDIFLDIACFFKGKRRDFVERILDDCGAFADNLRNLIDKSLITITHDNKLWMHDLVQEMGRAIVRQQCLKEPGKRSRLWSTHDVCHVLKNNCGTSTIEGMFLNTFEINEDIDMKPIFFKEMYNLRLLKIVVRTGKCKLHVSQGLDFLPGGLRYLQWIQYPLKSLPSSFTANNLVKLSMPLSQLEQLWSGFQHLESLRFVNLCFSKKLTRMSNMSRANLKIVDFEGCTSLVEVPSLRFQQCFAKSELERNKKTFLNEITSNVWSKREDLIRYGSSLLSLLDYSLNLSGCSNLRTLSEMSGAIENIYLRSTAIEELHCSIWSLEHLALLDLNNCKCLKNLPSNICKLESLKEINLGGCISINKFPELPKNIIRADLSGTAIEHVPSSSFECLPSLEILYLKNCKRLESLSTSICKLKSLEYLNLSNCPKLKSFPEILEPMERLLHLYLDGSGIEEIHWSIENLIGLRRLFLRECKNLKFVTSSIYKSMSRVNDLRLTDFSRGISLETNEYHCLQENEVWAQFEYLSEGSSVNFKFSPSLLDSAAIVRLYLCMVVKFKYFLLDIDHLKFFCECHFKCQKKIRRQAFAKLEEIDANNYRNSKYLFSWFLEEKYSNIHYTDEVSFKVYVDGEKLFDVGQVKKCGIKVLNILPDYEKISLRFFEELPIVQVFEFIDTNRDGKITVEELLSFFLAIGEQSTLEDCRRMVDGVDKNRDGFVCLEDFSRTMAL